MPLPDFQMGQPMPQQQDLGQILQEQHQMVGPNGFGGYMDQNVRPQSIGGSGLQDLLILKRQRELARQNDMRTAAMQMKLQYPNMPDHHIGQTIQRMFEQKDIQDAQFGLSFETSQRQLEASKLGY